MTNIAELAIELASEEYPVGTIGTGCTANRMGVWKMMNGIENFHPGSGVAMSGHGEDSAFSERVA